VSGDWSVDEITSEAEFEAALSGLLDTALQSDLDPQGSWVYTDGHSDANLEVEIYELE
jgi:hypothetical protein